MAESSGVGCNVQVAEILNCSELAVPIAETPRRSLIGMWVSRLLWPGTAVLDVGSCRILRDSERPDLFDFQCGGRGQVKYRQGIVHPRLGILLNCVSYGTLLPIFVEMNSESILK